MNPRIYVSPGHNADLITVEVRNFSELEICPTCKNSQVNIGNKNAYLVGQEFAQWLKDNATGRFWDGIKDTAKGSKQVV